MEGCELVMNGQPLPDFDVECPLMSLPYVFDTRLESIPPAGPIPQPEPDIGRAWEKKLPGKSGRLRVGLAWAGNPDHNRDATRSIALEQLAPLAKSGDVVFISLQKNMRPAPAAYPPPGMTFIDLTSDIQDFADTAALISNLDLVISVDTAVAHLAATMGKPVWLLLAFNPDWRWMLDREDSPWYPTMRLFRQQSRGDWKDVIERAANVLKSFTL
jgi:hypothetical protein